MQTELGPESKHRDVGSRLGRTVTGLPRVYRRLLGDVVPLEIVLLRRLLRHLPETNATRISTTLGLHRVMVDTVVHRGWPSGRLGRAVLVGIGALGGAPLYAVFCGLATGLEWISITLFHHNLAEPKSIRHHRPLKKALAAKSERPLHGPQGAPSHRSTTDTTGQLGPSAGPVQPSSSPRHGARATSSRHHRQQGPVQNIIVILRENHSYDHYLGRLPIGDGDPTLPDCPNPQRYPDPLKPTHGSSSWLNRDAMAVREQMSERDIPLYWEWAREYGVHDRFFAAIGGPSTPNHLMIITGDAGGLLNNPYDGVTGRVFEFLRGYREPAPPFSFHTLPGELTAHGISWRNYGGAFFQDLVETRNSPHTFEASQFIRDAEGGDLPVVSWVYSSDPTLNEHAPNDVTAGMHWTARQVEAVVRGGLWDKSVILIVWDDYGGWYDHVQPRKVERWTDGRTPYRDGSRLPFLVLSPWSRRGVNSTYLTHCSIPRFIHDQLDIPPLNDRVRQANGLDSCFSLTQRPLPPPITSVRDLQLMLRRDFATSVPISQEAGMRHDELAHSSSRCK